MYWNVTSWVVLLTWWVWTYRTPQDVLGRWMCLIHGGKCWVCCHVNHPANSKFHATSVVLLIVLFVTSAKLNLRPSPDGFASKCGMPHFVAFAWGNIKIAHRMEWGSQWGYPVQQLDISTSESQPEWCCKHSKKPSLQRRLWCFCGVFSGNVVSVCQWKMCVTSSDVGK